MKKTFTILTIMLLTSIGYSANPQWEMSSNEYEHSMSFSGIGIINGVEVRDTADQLVALVDGEVRGVTKSFYVEGTDRYYYFLLVYSNGGSELIDFKFYDASQDVVLDLSNTEAFDADASMGTFSTPYVFKDDYVYTFSSFGIAGLDAETNINAAQREILIETNDNATDLTSLIAEFEFIGATSITIEGVEQVSGVTTNDYSESIEMVVVTSSQEIFVWTVSLNVITGMSQGFNSKTTIYPNPTKGELTIDKANLGLVEVYSGDGQFLFSKEILNHKLDLTFLEAGIYFIQIDGRFERVVKE